MSDDLELQGWFYVGCGPREIGHYVWEHTGQKFRHHTINFNWCDGSLQYPSYTQLYVATFSRLGGYGNPRTLRPRHPASAWPQVCPFGGEPR